MKTAWGPGVILQNDARLGGRDPIKWLIIKRMKGWVLMVAINTGRASPPARKLREKEFQFMVDRHALRYVKKISLRTKKMQGLIRGVIQQEFPELLKEMENFHEED